jgi:tRNA threonylcarbamoyladenosine biosynthesis protein TsaB
MNILAVDTSSSACVLGVRTDEQSWTDEAIVDRSHSKEVLPRIEALLNRAGVDKSSLDLIVYGQGPGSFTGLRIGVGVVQGLAYGLGIPVVGVSSLACLAQKQLRLGGGAHALVALTARHTEVYFGAYAEQNGYMQLLGHEGVFEAAAIPAQNADNIWVGVGSGWKLAETLTSAAGVTISSTYLEEYPEGTDLLDLGEAGYKAGAAKTAPEALPEYLREQVAAKPT